MAMVGMGLGVPTSVALNGGFSASVVGILSSRANGPGAFSGPRNVVLESGSFAADFRLSAIVMSMSERWVKFGPRLRFGII